MLKERWCEKTSVFLTEPVHCFDDLRDRRVSSGNNGVAVFLHHLDDAIATAGTGKSTVNQNDCGFRS
jgi:hypothetical protein